MFFTVFSSGCDSVVVLDEFWVEHYKVVVSSFVFSFCIVYFVEVLMVHVASEGCGVFVEKNQFVEQAFRP